MQTAAAMIANITAQFETEMGYRPALVEVLTDGLAFFSSPGGTGRHYWARLTSRGIKKNSIRLN